MDFTHNNHAQDQWRKNWLASDRLTHRAAALDRFADISDGFLDNRAANQTATQINGLNDRDSRAVKNG